MLKEEVDSKEQLWKQETFQKMKRLELILIIFMMITKTDNFMVVSSMNYLNLLISLPLWQDKVFTWFMKEISNSITPHNLETLKCNYSKKNFSNLNLFRNTWLKDLELVNWAWIGCNSPVGSNINITMSMLDNNQKLLKLFLIQPIIRSQIILVLRFIEKILKMKLQID